MLAIPVLQLMNDKDYNLCLTLLAGRGGLGKKIVIPRIQKPGLALVGRTECIHEGRVQVFSKTEVAYLESISPKEREKIIAKICNPNLTCFVFTCGFEPSKQMIDECEKNNIPLFVTPLLTFTFVNRLNTFLDDHLRASTCMHGVLMDVFGVGVLIIGRSGIGKSELALDLILRGHRLIADDVVNIKKQPPSTLYGACSDIIKYHMEIRGLGIINIKDLFGIAATRDHKIIELVIELEEWNPQVAYDRLGIDEHQYNILGVNLPFIKIPVRPGRNISAIVEIAARNHLLKVGGYHAARQFQERLNQEILAQTKDGKDEWKSLE